MFQKIKSFLFHNTNDKQTVAKNTIWLTISNFGGRAIKAIVVIYAARSLDTSNYGIFSYAIAVSTFLALFMDPGVNAILMRDGAKSDPKDQRSLFSTMFVMKLVLLVIGVCIIIFIVPTFSVLPGSKIILPIIAVILGLDTMRDFFTSLVRSQERMEWDAGIFLLTNLGILISGFIFLTIQPSPSSFAWAYVAGDAIGIMLALWVIRNYFKDLISHIDLRKLIPILNEAWPFAVTGALGILLTSADILIISWMRSAAEVGIYAAAIRIVQVLYLIPTVFQFSALPLFSRLAFKETDRFRAALERIIKFIFLAATPLAIGGLILGTQIMTFIFGASYASGGMAFRILMVGLLFDFPATLIGTAVFAYRHQKNLIITSAIAGITNIIFDLLFIPRFGITGSAVATLIAQILSNWYLWRMMKKLNYFEVMPSLGKIAFAGIGMAIITGLLSLIHVNLIFVVGAGAAVYLVLLYITREQILKEVRNIVRSS